MVLGEREREGAGGTARGLLQWPTRGSSVRRLGAGHLGAVFQPPRGAELFSAAPASGQPSIRRHAARRRAHCTGRHRGVAPAQLQPCQPTAAPRFECRFRLMEPRAEAEQVRCPARSRRAPAAVWRIAAPCRSALRGLGRRRVGLGAFRAVTRFLRPPRAQAQQPAGVWPPDSGQEGPPEGARAVPLFPERRAPFARFARAVRAMLARGARLMPAPCAQALLPPCRPSAVRRPAKMQSASTTAYGCLFRASTTKPPRRQRRAGRGCRAWMTWPWTSGCCGGGQSPAPPWLSWQRGARAAARAACARSACASTPRLPLLRPRPPRRRAPEGGAPEAMGRTRPARRRASAGAAGPATLLMWRRWRRGAGT